MTLESLGYVSSDARLFELTPKVLDLGYAYVSSLKVADIAQPFMEALSERVHESVSASVLDGPDIIYVARVPTKRIMTVSLAIGSRLPAEMTSMGRVLLSELPEPQLDAFLATARMNLAFFEGLSAVQRATTLTHPEYGTLTLDWIIHQMAGHHINHLLQLQQII